MTTKTSYILTLSCPDSVGIVAAATGVLAREGALITDAQHHREAPSDSTVLRVVFESGVDAPLSINRIREQFADVAARFRMSWRITDQSDRMRVLIAVSQQGHCLNSLLHRWATGSIPIEVVGVVSNHTAQRRLAEWHGLPFHCLPINEGRKAEQEAALLELCDRYTVDLLVLARYMQILSGDTCRKFRGRAINIHHSFLPSFKGASPYRQAYARGVKLIGATAHYIDENLDEGPIIEQATERVDHTFTVDQLTTLGNDVESIVLNRAVQWHAEQRVFEFGSRTVVLR
jgi:formyltetrahydrofolate deformylase